MPPVVTTPGNGGNRTLGFGQSTVTPLSGNNFNSTSPAQTGTGLSSTPSFGTGSAGGAGTTGAAAAAAAAAAAGNASGLGTLTPATSQIGLAGSGANEQAHARAKDNAKTRAAAHSTGPVSVPSFIGQPFQGIANAAAIVINKIPWYIWLALGALAVVATGAIGAAYRSSRRIRRQAGAMAAVSAAALTDPLTGVLNRRGFTEAVERELARARRYDRPFVLAYVDVRGLKAVNDTEGHLAGDELLKGVSRLLRDSARADDVVGRLGGDELGLLLVEQSAEGAEVVTSRIQSLFPSAAPSSAQHPLGPDDRHRRLPRGRRDLQRAARRRRPAGCTSSAGSRSVARRPPPDVTRARSSRSTPHWRAGRTILGVHPAHMDNSPRSRAKRCNGELTGATRAPGRP